MHCGSKSHILTCDEQNKVESDVIEGKAATAAYDVSLNEAERHGHGLFAELIEAHEDRLIEQQQKRHRTIESRRKAIERIGLPQVRNHRLKELEKEDSEWQHRLSKQDTVLPELTALLVLRIDREIDVAK